MRSIDQSRILTSNRPTLEKLVHYLKNDLAPLEIECVTVFGSSTFDGFYSERHSDVDIVAYSSVFSRENAEIWIAVIEAAGGDFKDKRPIFLEDCISPRIEYFYMLNGITFDINIFPYRLNGYDTMETNVVHDSVDIVIGAMYQRAVVLFGRIPFEDLVEREFMPFYSETLRMSRMQILEARINDLLLRIREKVTLQNPDVFTYVLKLRAYFLKWLFINNRKYPIDVNNHIEYQLKEYIGLPQGMIDALMMKQGDSVSDMVNCFADSICECMLPDVGKSSKINEAISLLDISTYFGDYKKSNFPLLNKYISMLDHTIEPFRNYGHPFLSGNYSVDFYNHLKNRSLNNESMAPEDVFSYLASYYSNVPDWSNPGTMVNVIPVVNLVTAAAVSVSEIFNPNFAQDTYSGNLILSELEVGKYISELLGWDWKKSFGIFTFGGTGTNLYGTKLALCNADPEAQKSGVKQDAYFILTSTNGHPCHLELCDWLGIGSNSCLEIPCNRDGMLDTGHAEAIIRENLKKGKKFLGFNLNGGSTNEMTIDPIREIFELNHKIVAEYALTYVPKIHVDSVLGWVYLFFSDYDFVYNELNLDSRVLPKIQSLYNKVAEMKYADSIGIDFHKTGFCPYVTSMFLVRDRQDFYKLNPEREIAVEDMHYGDYNPYLTSLEYSRSCHGPIAALSCLKSLGKKGFRQIVGNLFSSSAYFRELLSKNQQICIIDGENEGFATMFVLVPDNFQHFYEEDILNFTEDQVKQIRRFNNGYGKYIISESVNGRISFFFTSSRSYSLPGTDIKVGTLKAYPMSVFLNREEVERIVSEVNWSIREYFNKQYHEDRFTTDEKDLFNDMSRPS